MATSIAIGSGNLPFKEMVCRGQVCRQSSSVSGITFQRFVQKELSWLVIRSNIIELILSNEKLFALFFSGYWLIAHVLNWVLR